MDSTQTEISALLGAQAEAIRTKDLDRLISLYSSDVMYFDVVPPLRFAGSAALRERQVVWRRRSRAQRPEPWSGP